MENIHKIIWMIQMANTAHLPPWLVYLTHILSLLVRPGGDLDLGGEGASLGGGEAGAQIPDEVGEGLEIGKQKQESD
jgi:hypothetical protein